MIKIGFAKFFKNRFNILYIIIFLIIVLLAFKLATLTIVEGDKYRENSDIKTIKNIPIKAPRGKIYDRNGKILADNLTSFTVQIYKSKIKSNKFLDTIVLLTDILEQNGENLIDEFPIVFNVFQFDNSNSNMNIDNKNNEENKNSYSPTEKIINIIKEENLLYEWLNTNKQVCDETIDIKQRLYFLLRKEIRDLPIKYDDNKYIYKESDDNFKKWLNKKLLNENSTPEEVINYYLTNDDRYIVKLLANAKIRKVTYEFLVDKGKQDNIVMKDYAFVYDSLYKDIKFSLMQKYDGITMETSAKDDFVYLIRLKVFDKLFGSWYKEVKGNFVPGKYLIGELKNKYSDLPIEVEILDNNKVNYLFTDNNIKTKYIKDFKLKSTISAYEMLKTIAYKENDILNSVVTSQEICYYAQSELLNMNINPSISVSSWLYSPNRDKKIWIETNIKSKLEDFSPKIVFDKLKEELKLKEESVAKLTDYDIRDILVVLDRSNKQGYRSYYPIDICYNISQDTVAMISEKNYELEGVNVEIEPIRFYPEGKTASHVLGYLGKISQDYEIKEYTQQNGYSLDDIIGKTGIEEKFEKYLKGTKGRKTVAVNATGNTIKSVDQVAPIPGNNVYTTIDLSLQKKVEDCMERCLIALQNGGTYESEWGNHVFDKNKPMRNATSASLVALDAKTGEVLALANYPSYDPNLFSTGISSEDWNSLNVESKNPLAPRPLYNSALLTQIQPGSTFKMVTCLAALEKGVNPSTNVHCSGVMTVGLRKFGCWIYNMFHGKHGNQNMYQAIKNSCNYYFYVSMLGENPVTGQKHTVKLDFNDVTNMAKKFGLDDPTGIEIDIPKEKSGGVPNIEAKQSSLKFQLRFFLEQKLKYYKKDNYDITDAELNKAIESIVSWIDQDNMLTRSQVYRKLLELGINPEKTYNSTIPIVDIIKYTYINQSVWNSGDSLNLSIGQGSNAYTPIQMANYVAILANGGYRNNVSVINKVMNYNNSKEVYKGERKTDRIDLKDYNYLNVVKEGMLLVANDSADMRKLPIKIGVKTGTAQKDGINPETGKPYDDFAWYVAFAPYDDPQIAVSCVVFQGGLGLYPSVVVRDVIGEYLSLNGTIEKPVLDK